MTKKFLLASLLLAELVGCASPRPFERPVAALPAAWSSAVPLQDAESGKESAWWQLFGDATLDSLITQAAAQNPDLQIAAARLMQSRALLQVESGAEFPQVDLGARYQRRQSTSEGHFDPSGNNGTAPYDYAQAGVEVAWEPDFWGRTRDRVQAAAADNATREEERHGVLIGILAETARDYLEYRATRRQREISSNGLMLARKNLELVGQRVEAGLAATAERDQSATLVATLEAQVPALDNRAAQLGNALALLLGEAPFALDNLLKTDAELPAAPAALPVEVPSMLAQRRPDIRAAEARLRAAAAHTDLARAQFYPSISLIGNVGFEALQLASLGSWDTRSYSAGPVLRLPIFEGGKLQGQLALSQGREREAAVDYQRTVLRAWHEIENALLAYDTGRQRQEAFARAVTTQDRAFTAIQHQYEAGATDYLHVLSANKDQLQIEAALIQARLDTGLAVVTLYKALGGGWESFVLTGTERDSQH